MKMTRKAAMLSMLMGAISSAQDKFKITPQEGDYSFSKYFADPPATHARFISFAINDPAIDVSGERFMLEVKADGRVARFTAKEVMDALGGWFEPEAK